MTRIRFDFGLSIPGEYRNGVLELVAIVMVNRNGTLSLTDMPG